jgi:hypothetical protein
MELLLQIAHALASRSLDLLEAVGIVFSLGFTAASFRREARSRRLSNLLVFTQEHREIWSQLFTRPELSRVLRADPDLSLQPVTDAEALFVTFVIFHVNVVFRAQRDGEFSTRQAIAADVHWFFNLPIPSVVWIRSRAFAEPDFADFIENCRGS